jgi:hypothetical protein
MRRYSWKSHSKKVLKASGSNKKYVMAAIRTAIAKTSTVAEIFGSVEHGRICSIWK